MKRAAPPLDPKETLATLRGTADTLWTHLAPGGKPESTRRILFTAPAEGQGTTTVALCAAMGLARHLKATVTLVETGAPSTALATMLGAEPSPGFSEALAGVAERAAAIRKSEDKAFFFVPAGSRPFEHGELTGGRARELVEVLGTGRDYLLIDAPPILLHPEAHALLWGVDQAVVVLEAGRSRKDQSQALIRLLHDAQVEVLGCVLNRYKPELPGWIAGSHTA
jgi:MinD-like ATPase involved in chromosome partitioning or flagellar assembly